MTDPDDNHVVELALGDEPHGLVITVEGAAGVALDLGLEEPSLDGAGVRVGEIP